MRAKDLLVQAGPLPGHLDGVAVPGHVLVSELPNVVVQDEDLLPSGLVDSDLLVVLDLEVEDFLP